MDITIKPVGLEDTAALAELLVQTVAAGGSVSFMHPLPPAQAEDFWRSSLEAAARGGRVVLGAFVTGRLVGTVTLLLDCPPNQPHRGEIAKMMTAVAFRGNGIARALLQEAERRAIAAGRTLLTLDTAEEAGAAGLYERLGYTKAGVIPDFALKPHGGLVGTVLFYKRVG
ncbi:N-acetyltransferase family protein [Chitinophaga lutea]